jgi:integrase
MRVIAMSIRKVKNKNSSFSYKVSIRRKGFKDVYATFPNKKDALAYQDKTLANLTRQHYDPSQRIEPHTVADALKKYAEDKNYGTNHSTYQRLMWWDDRIGEMNLSDLHHTHIEHHLEHLQSTNAIQSARNQRTDSGKKRSPATINRYHGALSAALSWVRKHGKWINHNPALDIARKPENNTTDRFLREYEVDSLRNACKKQSWNRLWFFACLALCTGARKNELLTLRWSQVDIKPDRATITLSRKPPVAG